jgi:hypothetical protein
VDQFNNIGATGEEVVLMKVWDIPWFRDFPEARQEIRQSVITAAQGKLVRDELEIPGAGDATATIDFSIKPVPGRDNEIPVLLASVPRMRNSVTSRNLRITCG